MKYTLALTAAASILEAAVAAPANLEPRQGTGAGGTGQGPYAPGAYKTDTSLPNHTIYYPTKDTGSEKLQVLVYGNGGCQTKSLAESALLYNVASYGFLVIAEGTPTGGGTSTAKTMGDAIDWIAKTAGTGAYANVDGKKIIAAGFSCGGVEAMDNTWNSNVKSIGIVSSGLLQNYTAAKDFTKPVVFILGGSSDIAYTNGERDFKALPNGTPSWKGNIPVGHGGTLQQAGGGLMGKALVNWMLYHLKGQQAGLDYLTTGYKADNWTVETHQLDLLKPL